MSASKIKAGEAFVELSLRDRLNEGLAKAAGRLRLFAESVKAMKVADVFKKLGQGLAFMGGALAAAGGGVLAVLGNAVATFLEVSRHARIFGLAINGIDPSKAKQLSAALNTIKAVFGAIKFFTGAALAEPLTQLLLVLTSFGAKVAVVIRDNQMLVVAIAALAGAALAAGTAILGLGVAFSIAGAAISGAVTVVAALASPLAIVLGLVAAFAAVLLINVAAWMAFTNAGQTAMSGIAAAIQNGDIAGAWGIVVQTMAVMWAQFSEGIVNVFSAAANAVVEKWQQAVSSIAMGLLKMSAQGGIMGKIASLIVGADVAALKAENDRIDAKRGIKQDIFGIGADSIKGSTDAIAGPVKDFLDAMKEAAEGARKVAVGDLKGAADAQKNKLAIRLSALGDFAAVVGAESARGSSAGTASGRGAALLGVGSKASTADQEAPKHTELLKQIIKAINGVNVAAEFQ